MEERTQSIKKAFINTKSPIYLLRLINLLHRHRRPVVFAAWYASVIQEAAAPEARGAEARAGERPLSR